jgi:hypothetical protein
VWYIKFNPEIIQRHSFGSTLLSGDNAPKHHEASFYEKLGMGGDQSQGWLILKNGSTVIGLFQGM